ncbi:protein of unknown function [endosymbiont DhMRE of Dentiscutata heterogama]|uniref:hypothetical protein n=1 Tax=endosymbiont DhMRE of Dentiscutata heterogama TaxID=1609546 RepID=UPI000629D682|nr:hypothetical protein [endosymbiont DhMRE of Dentiscutata heterogama]CFW93380.1 protein of unknown function [endosymbiont DhMRE of Dentiscutata heterogama]
MLKTFSAYNSPIKRGKCDSCQTEAVVMQLPIIKTIVGKEVTEKDKKMNDYCYNCIREMRIDLINREKINKIYTNKDQDAVSENSQRLMIEFLQKMEKFFEDFEKGEIRKCIFCEKDETEKIMAGGEEYDYSAYYAKLEPNQGVCVDCFRLVKEERTKSSDIKSDKIHIAKIITEKAGKEWKHEWHCDACQAIMKITQEIQEKFDRNITSKEGADKLGRSMVDKIIAYKNAKGSLCEDGEEYLKHAKRLLKGTEYELE